MGELQYDEQRNVWAIARQATTRAGMREGRRFRGS